MDAVYSIGKGLITAIQANSAINDLVQGRIYHDNPPAGAGMPHIRYYQLGGGYQNTAPGGSNELFITVSVISNSRTQAQSLRSLVNDLLHMQDLDFPDGWYSWDAVREVGKYEYEPTGVQVQGDSYFDYSADYRFRVYLG